MLRFLALTLWLFGMAAGPFGPAGAMGAMPGHHAGMAGTGLPDQHCPAPAAGPMCCQAAPCLSDAPVLAVTTAALGAAPSAATPRDGGPGVRALPPVPPPRA